MHPTENTKYILATIGILLIGVGFAFNLYGEGILSAILPAKSEAVHVHADFAFFVLGNKVDLTDLQYQSSAESVKHPTMHFHDGVDTMIHRHAEGITLGDFMSSIGLQLTDSCTTLATSEQHCTDEANSLILFVNGKEINEKDTYIIEEEDRILLYYGDPKSSDIKTYQDSITDEACLYSGNCPERGEPPFESCGLTCEI